MPKIVRAHKNYLTPEIWEETHLRKIFYSTLIFSQSSMICIGSHVGGHAFSLQHGGQNYLLFISCSTFHSYAQMCCKGYHIIFSTFSWKFKCKICVQREVIHNFLCLLVQMAYCVFSARLICSLATLLTCVEGSRKMNLSQTPIKKRAKTIQFIRDERRWIDVQTFLPRFMSERLFAWQIFWSTVLPISVYRALQLYGDIMLASLRMRNTNIAAGKQQKHLPLSLPRSE